MPTPVVIRCSKCEAEHVPPLPVRCAKCGDSFAQCRTCKYDLADSPDGPCPECGVQFAKQFLLDDLVRERIAAQETWDRRVNSGAKFIGSAAFFVLLVASCAFSPPLTMAVIVLGVLAWVVRQWKLNRRDSAYLTLTVLAAPALVYGVVLVIDGINTMSHGSRYWTSFDVLTWKGLRPMSARRVVTYGGVITLLTGLALAAITRGWRRSRKLARRKQHNTSASMPQDPGNPQSPIPNP